MGIQKEIISYGPFGKCARLSNGTVELLVTVDIGPRIIRYGFIGGKNEFAEAYDKGAQTELGFWRMLGGHRLWSSPEGMPFTYTPDDKPVEYVWTDNGVKVTSAVWDFARQQKELDITLDEKGTGVGVTMRLYNRHSWDMKYAIWSLSVMAPGGKSVIPQNDAPTGLLPNRLIALWAYTNTSDPRYTFGEKHIIFRHDAKLGQTKIGLPCEKGWVAHVNEDVMFVKKFPFIAGAEYPDYGCSYETYTCDYMMELESLSPLEDVKPGGFIEHKETWELFKDVKFEDNEAGAQALQDKYIK